MRKRTVILTFLFFALSVFGYLIVKPLYDRHQILNALESEGLKFTVDRTSQFHEWVLSGKKPFIIKLVPKDGVAENISIYTFHSRKAPINNLEKFDQERYYSEYRYYPRSYAVDNVLVFYWYSTAVGKPMQFQEEIDEAISSLDGKILKKYGVDALITHKY